MASEKMTVARAMVKALEAEGITTVFGYPGAAICPFYDELISSDIRHVLVRHEVNGGHAASGYARMTGKPAVAIATSGPGATNLITAIATAHMDSIPMVLITGQVSCEQIGRDVFQEADITGAAEPFVKHSYLVKDPAEMPVIFKNAFYIAGSGRPGPVLIDMPFDVQKSVIDFEYPKTVDIRSYKPSIQGNKLQIKRAVAAIEKSKKASYLCGRRYLYRRCGKSAERVYEGDGYTRCQHNDGYEQCSCGRSLVLRNDRYARRKECELRYQQLRPADTSRCESRRQSGHRNKQT